MGTACLRWLTRDPPDLTEAKAAAMSIVADGTRAAEIIDRVRSFYKKGSPAPRAPIDVNEIAREMLVLLRNEADRHSIVMRTHLTDVAKVTADRVQLQQVFMNLMLNGIEAMKETGGELTVKSQSADDGQILISVSDTGVGLPAGHAVQLFKAFFTTKPQGLGIGLVISRSIIESHGGRLWAAAGNSGRGATFYFTLTAARTQRSSSSSPKGLRKITKDPVIQGNDAFGIEPVLERSRIVDGRSTTRTAQIVPPGVRPVHSLVASRSAMHDRRTKDADSNEGAAAPWTLKEGACTRDEPRSGEPPCAAFGPFCLRAAERLLEKDGLPVRVGSRALDILIALVERAPEVVSKRDLITRVWSGLVVDEGSLRYHIVALRKALGDGRGGVRYVTNVAGRGYCFVSPISRSPDRPAIRASDRIDRGSLPAPLLNLIGRDDVIQRVMIQLTAQRFVSLVGPGGIGKTAVAVHVAYSLLPEFDGKVHFVDLGALAPATSVSDALASALGLAVDRGASLPYLLAWLRERRVLLVLDNCEHVVETVAELAHQLFRAAPQIHILVTSREHLRIEGEWVIPVAPLGYPSACARLTAAEALRFPAVQLFVQLVAANVHPFELSDAEALVVCDICRRVDGVPLALELTAGRVRIFGIRGTAALLGNACCLLWPGRRSRPPRHRTLYASLDWSYNLLSVSERLTLHRLSRIDGPFCLEAAAGDQVASAPLAEDLARLAEKSLVCVDVAATPPQYRLLEATRAYVAQKIAESGEAARLERQQVVTRHGTWVEQVRSFQNQVDLRPTKSGSREAGPTGAKRRGRG